MEPEGKKIKRVIWTFSAASFLNDMGSDIIYPIWPLFVTTVLRANMAALGFLDGLGEALVSLSQAASGYLSDRIKKRKVFIWTGYFLGAVSRLGYSFSTAWPHLIPFRLMDRAGKIRSAPRDAIVADLSTDETRGKNFGLLRAMDNLGAVAGIVICIVLVEAIGYRLLFALAALPSLLSVLLIYLTVKEKKSGTGRIKIYKGISFRDLGKNFKLFLLLSAVFALGSFSYSFLLISAKNSGFNTTFIPVLYLIFTVSASLFSYPFGRLSDKVGRKSVLLLSYFLWAGVCVSFIYSKNHLMTAFAFAVYGAHKGALEPVQKTFVSELAPCDFRASCLGGFQMVIGLFALPASFAAGLLWETVGPVAPFIFSAVLTLLSGTILIFVKKD